MVSDPRLHWTEKGIQRATGQRKNARILSVLELFKSNGDKQ